MLVCLPSAAPIGLSPLHILTLCGSERDLVVATEPLERGGGGCRKGSVSTLGGTGGGGGCTSIRWSEASPPERGGGGQGIPFPKRPGLFTPREPLLQVGLSAVSHVEGQHAAMLCRGPCLDALQTQQSPLGRVVQVRVELLMPGLWASGET